MKGNETRLRVPSANDTKSLVTKDSPDDFTYEGEDNTSPIASAETILPSKGQSVTQYFPSASTKQPYVKVDNPDDFE